MIFDHDDVEIELDINATKYRPATRHSPEEDAEMEIVHAYINGKEIDEELFEHLQNEHHDDIFEQFVDESIRDSEDYN